MAYSGKFSPKNPSKYLGNPTNIWYRSLWERRVMEHLDDNPGVMQWSSEEIVIPYLSPVDNKYHRYFPDFFVRTTQGAMILEVKPHSQSVEPKMKKRKTKGYITEVMTYGVNQAKWKAADEYCKDRGWKFKVVTEKDIFKK
jgi:TnsA endonuclease N terminal